ncbi:hypothetical protein AGLY_016988 [Aphis glycines]|uniref:Uncharacterized protein n=1 Tax=Aphis glycines TaxID=307491 RepID=A0A6G0SX03_APHGL|nr:hypothetical protein AGLY_016988 [Aphis glycines]
MVTIFFTRGFLPNVNSVCSKSSVTLLRVTFLLSKLKLLAKLCFIFALWRSLGFLNRLGRSFGLSVGLGLLLGLPKSINCWVLFNTSKLQSGVSKDVLFDGLATSKGDVPVFSINCFHTHLIHGIKGVNFIIFSKGEQVIKPNLALKNSIFIFDDVILDNQSPIREFFTMGRHSGASSIFYLAQTYSKIPKQLVRDNSNFLIILKQDDKNLHHIFNDHSSADMNFLKFRKISHLCWNHNDYGFLVIDKTREMGKGRYRCGFHTFIKIK